MGAEVFAFQAEGPHAMRKDDQIIHVHGAKMGTIKVMVESKGMLPKYCVWVIWLVHHTAYYATYPGK